MSNKNYVEKLYHAYFCWMLNKLQSIHIIVNKNTRSESHT